MGPRSVERGKALRSQAAKSPLGLQWGRVLLNAERCAIYLSSYYGNALQWGRVLLNAERGFYYTDPINATVLQWGRVLLNAESVVGGCVVNQADSFNGAAFC